MNSVFAFIGVFLAQQGYAQKIHFSGSVVDKWDKIDTLFYTFNEQGFRPDLYILCKDKKYELSLSKRQIESSSIREIVFLQD